MTGSARGTSAFKRYIYNLGYLVLSIMICRSSTCITPGMRASQSRLEETARKSNQGWGRSSAGCSLRTTVWISPPSSESLRKLLGRKFCFWSCFIDNCFDCREQRAKGGVPRSGPIGGHTRVVRGGRGRGGGHEGRGRKRPNRYDDDGSSGGSRGKFSRYEDRRDMRVSRAACT